MRHLIAVPLLAIVAMVAMLPASAQDVARGKRAFEACAACHTGDTDGIGPDLTGVVGRRAGSLPGFRYSSAMKQSGITWKPATLKAFLQHPQTVVRGNRMPFAGIADPVEAEAVAHYLVTLK